MKNEIKWLLFIVGVMVYMKLVLATAPTHNNPILNTTNGLNNSKSELTGYNQTGSDSESEPITFSYIFYKQGVKNLTQHLEHPNLVLYFPFDDNFNNFAQKNSKNNNATYTPITGTNIRGNLTTGKIGKGLRINQSTYADYGSNGEVMINLTRNINLTNNFSIMFWMKSDVRILGFGSYGIIGTGIPGFNTGGWELSETDAGAGMKFEICMKNGSEFGTNAINFHPVFDSFSHFAVIVNDTIIRIYINGTLVESSFIFQEACTYTPSNITFGADTNKNDIYLFNGTFDEFKMFNKSLTEQEIWQDYTATKHGFAIVNQTLLAPTQNWTLEMTPNQWNESGTPKNSSVLVLKNYFNVNSCQNISLNNSEYHLISDIESKTDCLLINFSTNISLNCHGYSVNYSTYRGGWNGTGIYVKNSNNVNIQNCNIFTNNSLSSNETSTYPLFITKSFGVTFNYSSIKAMNNSGSISNYGIWVGDSANVNIVNNYLNVSYNAITITNGSKNISLSNNFINVSANNAIGISLLGNSSRNTFFNNTIDSNSSNNMKGILLQGNIQNNTFIQNTINSFNISILLNGSNLWSITQNNFNPLHLSGNNFTNNTFSPKSLIHMLITQNASNNYFINNQFNKSKIKFKFVDEANPVEFNNISIQWYLNINVTNSSDGGILINSQAEINNTFAYNLFSGIIDNTTQLITEMSLNGSVPQIYDWNTGCSNITNINLTCFTPLNISINLTGYNIASLSYSLNFSSNITISLTITPPVTDTCSCPASGNWNAVSSDNCIITSSCDLQGNNFRMTGNTGQWNIRARIFNIGTDNYIRCTNCEVRCENGACIED